MMAEGIDDDVLKVQNITEHLMIKYDDSYFVPLKDWEQFTIGLHTKNVNIVLNSINTLKENQDYDNKQFYAKDVLSATLFNLLPM